MTGAAGARELARVRAALRGIGGSLAVIGDGGAWTVFAITLDELMRTT